VFADGIAAGNTALLRLPGVLPLEAGIPLTVGGQVAGAVGVSGATPAQDGQIAQAGVKAFSASRGAE
jgi:uncharacterized protein GlcG (DUF336 family)